MSKPQNSHVNAQIEKSTPSLTDITDTWKKITDMGGMLPKDKFQSLNTALEAAKGLLESEIPTCEQWIWVQRIVVIAESVINNPEKDHSRAVAELSRPEPPPGNLNLSVANAEAPRALFDPNIFSTQSTG